MRLEDWYYVKYDGRTITMDLDDEVRLVGRVYDSPDYPDDAPIITSTIVCFKDNAAITFSGHKYELGKKSEAQNALLSGIPVIVLARMARREIMVDPPKDLQSPDFMEQMLNAEMREGIVLWGNDNAGNYIVGEVVKQDGNYFTLRVFDEETMEESDIKVYVCSIA